MAPKRYPRAPVAAPVTFGRLKARIEVLKKDRDQWKHKAVKLETFVTALANKVEQNTEVKKVFISVRRLWVGSKSACSQTKTTKLGRLPRLSGAPPVVACGDVPPPPPPSSPSDSSSAEGVGSEPTSADADS